MYVCMYVYIYIYIYITLLSAAHPKENNNNTNKQTVVFKHRLFIFNKNNYLFQEIVYLNSDY